MAGAGPGSTHVVGVSGARAARVPGGWSADRSVVGRVGAGRGETGGRGSAGRGCMVVGAPARFSGRLELRAWRFRRVRRAGIGVPLGRGLPDGWSPRPGDPVVGVIRRPERRNTPGSGLPPRSFVGFDEPGDPCSRAGRLELRRVRGNPVVGAGRGVPRRSESRGSPGPGLTEVGGKLEQRAWRFRRVRRAGTGVPPGRGLPDGSGWPGLPGGWSPGAGSPRTPGTFARSGLAKGSDRLGYQAVGAGRSEYPDGWARLGLLPGPV
jgi:hypothetical protein